MTSMPISGRYERGWGGPSGARQELDRLRDDAERNAAFVLDHAGRAFIDQELVTGTARDLEAVRQAADAPVRVGLAAEFSTGKSVLLGVLLGRPEHWPLDRRELDDVVLLDTPGRDAAPTQVRDAMLLESEYPRLDALPAPPRLGSWEFRLAPDRGDPERLDSPREIPETEDGPWHVVVDEDGEWWVLQGTPPYLTVDTLDAMDRHPGAVFSTPMDGRSMEDDSADPHNGEQ